MGDLYEVGKQGGLGCGKVIPTDVEPARLSYSFLIYKVREDEINESPEFLQVIYTPFLI